MSYVAIVLSDFISRYTLPNKNWCDSLIEWFEKYKGPEKKSGEYFSPQGIVVNKEHKDSTDIVLTVPEYYSHSCFVPVLDFLWECVQKYIKEYDILEGRNFTIMNQIKFQKYDPPSGGFKFWHYERLGITSPEFLVWMIYLNDVEKGGGTSFKYYNHTEKPQKGKLILWPADYTHTHRGEIAPDETKYILTGWYGYSE